MGLLKQLARMVRCVNTESPRPLVHNLAGTRRHRFESMELRRMLAADPVQVGAVYIEEDLGSDLQEDTFEVTFLNGEPGTQLTRIVINGDQAAPGFGEGDVFFDTAAGGFGADGYHPFQVVSLTTQDPNASARATVQDGSTQLQIDFTNFYAGDKLIFTIDVDEVEDYDPNETDPVIIADGIDPITSGVEFQSSLLTASFAAPHYHNITGQGEFRNRYDDQLAGTGLDLPLDDFAGRRDRTDGVVIELQQQPLPVSISGTVFLDHDLDLAQDASEQGLQNVELGLWQRQGNEFIFTGHTTQADINGDYEFGLNLNLRPGVFQVRETQPSGLFSVGAIAGTVAGQATGVWNVSQPDWLTAIEIPLGGQQGINFDFAEARPASISGHVYHDRSNDGIRDSGEEGIAGVDIQLIPVDTIAQQDVVSLTTDAQGFYSATGLVPGRYRVVEVAQPAGFFDGLDATGHVSGESRGSAANPGDRLEDILLLGGDAGVEYNFGELVPAAIEGRVHLSDPDGDCFNAGVVHPPLSGVTVRLLDGQGNQLSETRTGSDGRYRFGDLLPGVYSVVEVTPNGLIDGGERIGRIGGSTVGQLGNNDVLGGIVLASGQTGVDYDFCEHAPASVSGHVYHDADNSGVFDVDESAIAGVTVTLLDSNGNLVAEQATDSRGFYEFVGLRAGRYTLRETHPAGWIDGKDTVGRIGGAVVGSATNDEIGQVQLRWGDEGVDYDFGELLPVEIGGFVYHDRSNDGLRDPGEEGLAGVTVHVIPVNPQSPQDSVTVLTDANGRYFVDGLAPGSYRVVEGEQPAGFFDGLDTPGTVDGQTRGSVVNPGDSLEGILLASGDTGIEYNFGELAPAWVRGYVRLSDPNGDCFTSGAVGIEDVAVRLLNDRGQQIAATRTNADGEYNFSGLLPGSYTVVEQTPVGLIDGAEHIGHVNGAAVGELGGNDTIRNIIVSSGQEGFDYDFCEHAPASVSGHVYHDADNSGVFNISETPIAGVIVTLLDDSGNVVAQQGTDAQGSYEFAGLRAGRYTLRESHPAGWIDGKDAVGRIGSSVVGLVTNDEIRQVQLRWGDEGVDYDFGELLPVEIGGFVYHDRNNDGIRDPSEEGLAGVTVHVIPVNSQAPQDTVTVVTDFNGRYFVDGLAPGSYRIVEDEQPVGFFDGLDTPGTVDGASRGSVTNPGDNLEDIFLASGDAGIEYNFGELSPTWIRGHVRLTDPNGDCFTTGAVGIGDVTVLLLNDRGETIAETRTDANGEYNFSGLLPGSYTVVERTPAGLIDGTEHLGHVDGVAVGQLAGNDTFRNIVIGSGQEGLNYDFCEHAPASLSGHVYHDADNSGMFGANETPIAGVTVTLLDDSGSVIAEQDTDARGFYEFAGLRAGLYTLRETHPAGWIDGKDTAGMIGGSMVGSVANDEIRQVQQRWGDEGVKYDFGELLPVEIGGFVYHDRSNDGLRDPGEEGLGGVTVSVIPVNPQAPQDTVTVVTDSNGQYLVDGLAPGSYRIVEGEQPDGFFDGLDTPGMVNGQSRGSVVNPGDSLEQILLVNGDAGIEYNFGELSPTWIRGHVRLTDPDGLCSTPGSSDRGIENVMVLLFNDRGEQIAETRTKADGEYNFAGLLPGSYTVVEQTPVGLIDGPDHVGHIEGVSNGQLVGNDTIRNIVLQAGQEGFDYDFCEHEPAELSGRVYHDRSDNGMRELGEEPIPGVRVELWDSGGQMVAADNTDSDGLYSFTGLQAGVYTVIERQPTGWLDGQDSVGVVAMSPVGRAINPGDEIQQVMLKWGQIGSEYDFGELQAGSIGGRVHADIDGNCRFDSGEQPIEGVTIRLLDGDGVVIANTVTDSEGRYEFTGLAPGEYSVWETQPTGFMHGGQRSDVVGSNLDEPDLIARLQLGSGEQLVNNDFCEVPPASIAGIVHIDPDGDCRFDTGEAVLSGVTVQLLNENGDVIGTTQTDNQGRYSFEGLVAGRYSIRELQPAGYFHGGQRVGPGGGQAIGDDLLVLDLGAGQVLAGNNFCELPASSLSGFVFQDGPTIFSQNGSVPRNLATLRDGQRTADDKPIAGVVLELRDGLSGEPIMGDVAVPGFYGSGPIRTVTNSAGFYEFLGIPGGRSYAVYEIQPNGFIDGIDTPGTTSGLAINPNETVPEFIISRLVDNPKNDAIVLIPVGLGQSSQLNNFSEVLVQSEPPVPIPPRTPPPVQLPPVNTPPLVEAPPLVTTVQPDEGISFEPILTGGALAYSWHLSVINAGTPREVDLTDNTELGSWYVADHIDEINWRGEELREAQWTVVLNDDDGEKLRTYVFGIEGGIPVVGDFNGDGFDEIGVYYAGEWFIDLNGDGRWDERDVWAKLGDEHDLPVTGDWDADGKDDIGIFGPQWLRDPNAIKVEPGLPDASNQYRDRTKNLPPEPDEATEGHRLLQLQSDGRRRADVIDHVFRFGTSRDIPVAGDWNGDGIRTVGVFRDGQWRLDDDGDGRWTRRDSTFIFGQSGDLPVVGDFNGDGVEEIGVYRGGTWYVDTNRNRELDAHDKVFEMGGAADLPVAGDWNGDGADEPGLYRPGSPQNTAQRE